MLWSPCGQGGHGRELADAGDLVEERPGLPGEQVVLAVADRREVHRDALLDPRVLGADEHRSVAVGLAVRTLVGEGELARTVQVEGGRAVSGEHLEAQAVRQAVRDPADREGPDRTVGERRGERRDVLVLDRLLGRRPRRRRRGRRSRRGAPGARW